MTPLTWLTIFYQAACHQYHVHFIDNHSPHPASHTEGCLLHQNDNDDEEVENVPSSCSAGKSEFVEEWPQNCGCADCFLRVPQYSKRAYLQIVRVSLQLLACP